MGEKHGKQKHGARFSKKNMARDITDRANSPGKRNRPLPELIGLVKEDRIFWYWRRGPESQDNPEKPRVD